MISSESKSEAPANQTKQKSYFPRPRTTEGKSAPLDSEELPPAKRPRLVEKGTNNKNGNKKGPGKEPGDNADGDGNNHRSHQSTSERQRSHERQSTRGRQSSRGCQSTRGCQHSH